jgi:hypothetical protein
VALLSESADHPNEGVDGSTGTGPAVMNADGRFVAFQSTAGDLVTGFTDANGVGPDVYLLDRQTDSVTLVSHAFGVQTLSANGASFAPSISDDGRYIAYITSGTNLIAGYVDNGGDDAVVYDRTTGTTTIASHASNSTTAGSNAGMDPPVISPDGTTVTFATSATNLVAGYTDNNLGDGDVYTYALAGGQVTLVSHAAGQSLHTGNGNSFEPQIVGSTVLFRSEATNLVSGFIDNNAAELDLFVSLAGTTSLISHAPGSSVEGGNADTGTHVLSRDGSTAVFLSRAGNLVPGFKDKNGSPNGDVFREPLATAKIRVVSHSFAGNKIGGNGVSVQPVVDTSGRFVSYVSAARNLVKGYKDRNGVGGGDVFFFNANTGANKLVSHAKGHPRVGTKGLGGDRASISPDGRFVAFDAAADNLGYARHTNSVDVSLWDRTTNRHILVSHALVGPVDGGDGPSFQMIVAGSPPVVVFSSNATDLTTSFVDHNGSEYDLFEAV